MAFHAQENKNQKREKIERNKEGQGRCDECVLYNLHNLSKRNELTWATNYEDSKYLSSQSGAHAPMEARMNPLFVS